jgi:hypothetical protein
MLKSSSLVLLTFRLCMDNSGHIQLERLFLMTDSVFASSKKDVLNSHHYCGKLRG